MKRIPALFLLSVLLFSLAACRKIPVGPTQPIETTYAIRTEPTAAQPKLPAMAGVLANWAWGASNGSGEKPAATRLAVTGYALDADFARLDLAVGPFGQAKVTYKGEKQGDGSEQVYYPVYAAVTGPHFAFEKPAPVREWEPLLLVDSAALGEGLLPLEDNYDRATFSYPPASKADVSKAAALHPGRKVVDSQLLAATRDGGRVCLFLYENRPDEGLFSIVYLQGNAVLAIDKTTEHVIDGEAFWRADAEPDDVCLVQPVLLCRTQECILLIVAWSAPEGMHRMVFRENAGALEELSLGGMVYNQFNDTFYSTLEDEEP